jgi:hypothetical protein
MIILFSCMAQRMRYLAVITSNVARLPVAAQGLFRRRHRLHAGALMLATQPLPVHGRDGLCACWMSLAADDGRGRSKTDSDAINAVLAALSEAEKTRLCLGILRRFCYRYRVPLDAFAVLGGPARRRETPL